MDYWEYMQRIGLEADGHKGLNARIARAIGQKTVEETAEVFRFLRAESISTEYHAQWLRKQ